MHIPIPNAFTINRLGLQSAPFPLGFSRRAYDEHLVTLHAVPVRLVDLADLIIGHAQATVVLYDVSHHECDETGCFRPVESIAREQGLAGTPYDEGTIRIASPDLPRFLEGLPHYQLQMFDLARDADEDALMSSYVVASGHNWADAGPTLPQLPGSRLFLSIHDDCYLYLETTERALAQAILGRLLQIYVGTIVQEGTGQHADIRTLPPDVLNGVWQRFPSLTTFRENAGCEGTRVRIAFSATELTFREVRKYPVAGYLLYDTHTGRWELSV